MATATGNHRRVNEDAHLAGPAVFAVADGMGGHRAGDVASRLAVGVLAAVEPANHLTTDSVCRLVALAHAAIRDAAADDGARTGMGTTLVGAVPVAHAGAPAVAVFHAGDSRCYRLVDGRLSLVTRDHTQVQELVDAGHLTPADARRHRLRNIVTRALGVEFDDGPEVALLWPPIGRLLLCSDGLWAELEACHIGRVLAGIDDPQAAADRLVELALTGPARDNITALVVDLDLELDDARRHPRRQVTVPPMPPSRAGTRETGPERP